MNPSIAARFDTYQQRLVESAVVSRFTVLKLNVTQSDGRVRIRTRLTNEGLLEFAEYVAVDENDQVVIHAYSFHWQDARKQLIRRWDNVDHYPKLPHAPHHVHRADGTVEGNPDVPALAMVLAEIEGYLAQ